MNQEAREKAKKDAINQAWAAFGSSAGAYGYLYDAGYAAGLAHREAEAVEAVCWVCKRTKSNHRDPLPYGGWCSFKESRLDADTTRPTIPDKDEPWVRIEVGADLPKERGWYLFLGISQFTMSFEAKYFVPERDATNEFTALFWTGNYSHYKPIRGPKESE